MLTEMNARVALSIASLSDSHSRRYPGDNCPVVWGKCAHAFHLPVRHAEPSMTIVAVRLSTVRLTLQPTKSVFNQCITRWLQNNQTCPICRRDWEFASSEQVILHSHFHLCQSSVFLVPPV